MVVIQHIYRIFHGKCGRTVFTHECVDVSEIERVNGANECDFSLSAYIHSTFNVVLFIII